jgi:predicted Ser/Thr protein kinase
MSAGKRYSALHPFKSEQRALGKDGHYRWFLIHYNPLLDDQGRVIRWYATGTDINDRVQAEARTRNETLALREQIDRDSMFEDIVGASNALHKVLGQVCKAAPSDSTILILGETGTGKELIARAIHKRSNRADQAFIGVNYAYVHESVVGEFVAQCKKAVIELYGADPKNNSDYSRIISPKAVERLAGLIDQRRSSPAVRLIRTRATSIRPSSIP